MGGCAVNYNDKWIIENYLQFPSYKSLSEKHNELFGTNMKPCAMKNHCRYKLDLAKPRTNYVNWTKEEDEWFKENYPKLGVSKCALKLNKTKSAIKNRAITLGVIVKKEVATKNKRSPHELPTSKRYVKPIGYSKIECGRSVTKTEHGWEQTSRVIYRQRKEIPDGYCVLFLDGDRYNLKISNLEAVPRSYLGLLDVYNLRSEHPEITRTGIKWCELYKELN